MSISEQDLAVLYHNQMNYIDRFRSESGRPFPIPDDKIFELIKTTYSRTIQSSVFTLRVLPISADLSIFGTLKPQLIQAPTL